MNSVINSTLTIPIFPLKEVIFFPDTNLPLNVVEKRYIEMIDYALANKKLIGMIQPQNNNELYKVGCVGKITNFSETEDGRYVINLTGTNIFTSKKEVITDKKFKIFDVTIIEHLKSKNNQTTILNNKNILINKFSKFIRDKNEKISKNLLEEIEASELFKLIAMLYPFESNEKQALLESRDINDLSEKLITLFKFQENKEGNKIKIN